MKKIALCSLLVFFAIKGNAQETILKTDSIVKPTTEANTKKSINLAMKSDTINKQEVNPAVVAFKPNPTRAVIYSLIFPGLGQIYNRKYWKLPLVYGGFMGLTYAVTWNNGYLNDYSAGYKALMSDDPLSEGNREKWQNLLSYGANTTGMTADQVRSQYSGSFKRKKDFYRRNRDLSIIGMVALYGLCIIDAYVDAQLFEFDISPDISMRVEPTMINNNHNTRLLANQNTFGVQCSLKF